MGRRGVPRRPESVSTPIAAVQQLGFIIEELEPSAAVRGDRVNVYGYLSMAVAAIQVQDQQLGLPQREALTFSLSASSPTAPTTTLSPIT